MQSGMNSSPADDEHVEDDHVLHLPDPSDHESATISSLLRSALSNPDQQIAMLSNYSTSYNAVNVGIVLPVLKYSLSKSVPDVEPQTTQAQASLVHRILGVDEQSDEQDSIVASSLLAGMIFGQMLGGYLGDAIGRRNAMMLVMGLQIGASLGGAFISTDETRALGTLEQLAIWRFALGIGAGGVYPLAAVLSAENSENANNQSKDSNAGRRSSRHLYEPTSANEGLQSDEHEADENIAIGEISSFQRVALTFSMQGLGFITVPLLSYPMLAMQWNIDLIWRLLLGLGAVPGLFVMYLRLFRRCNSTELEDSNAAEKLHRRSEGGSLELTQPADDDEVNKSNSEGESSFQSTVSTLFSDLVDGDPSVHVSEDHQMALVNESHLDAGDRSEGVNDDVDRFNAGYNNESVLPSSAEQKRSLLSSIQLEPDLLAKFIGTAGTWFLFDVLFYGNTLFEPVVLEAAFGSKDDIEDGYTLLLLAVRDSLMISLLSLPGYFMTVVLIGRRTCVCRSLRTDKSSRCNSIFSPCTQTPAYIQMQGFLAMFMLYLIIGLYWTSLENIQWLLLIMYAGSFFFANYGPNSTTFLLPSITYSKECRSTLNGLSAAAGKFGALVGASAFEPAADRWGESSVMITCAIISLFGFILTRVCVVDKSRH